MAINDPFIVAFTPFSYTINDGWCAIALKIKGDVVHMEIRPTLREAYTEMLDYCNTQYIQNPQTNLRLLHEIMKTTEQESNNGN